MDGLQDVGLGVVLTFNLKLSACDSFEQSIGDVALLVEFTYSLDEVVT